MNKALAIGILAAAAAISSCGRDRNEDEGGGPTVNRNFQVGEFQRIEVAGPYEVEVRTGSAPTVQASGPEKDLERMMVEVRGDRLLIHPRKERGMFNMRWGSHGKISVAITVPQLSGAAIAGSGGISIDRVTGDRFKGEIAGSGNLNVGAIEAGAVELSIAGSGDIRAAGKARSVQYNIAGSGNIDASELSAETADISVAGSGNVTGNATGTASVSSLGSGNVQLTGGAKCKISKHGSGDVHCS